MTTSILLGDRRRGHRYDNLPANEVGILHLLHEPMASDAPAHEILPGLWLGNAKASMDPAFLQHAGIQVVVNCTKTQPFHSMVPVKYRLPVDDNLEEDEIRNMELWSTEIAYRILTEYRSGRRVLVHCMAGIQRSAAAVAMTLIAHLRIHARDAMEHIQRIRPIAFRPKANFRRAIETFDQRFHSEIARLL